MALILACLFATGCGGAGRVPPPSKSVKLDDEDYRLVWPLPIVTVARLTSGFGSRTDPVSGMRSFHTGVDLDGETGTPVHAAGAGEVVYSGERSGYGLLIIVDHGRGLVTYYGHCSRLLRSRGKRVGRGEVIALIGDTGRTTGSHLHFETRKHGQPVDPLLLLPKLKAV
ncbi:MAG: M23 family metallopeptidase [Candidatus Glassbacteria bacterium]